MKKLSGFERLEVSAFKHWRRVVLLAVFLFASFTVVPVFAEPVQAADPPEPVELTDNRTQTSKLYSLGGNDYRLAASVGSVHYQDGGQWLDIDNSWVEGTAPWDWEMAHDSYNTYAVEDFTAGQILKFEAQDETITFQPMALQWTNNLSQIQSVSMPQEVSPTITNTEYDILNDTPSHIGNIEWPDAYGSGVDFKYSNSPGKLNKLLTISGLNDLPPPQSWIILGGNPVLKLNFIFDPSPALGIYVDGELWNKSSKVTTVNNIEFRKDGVLVWWVASPHYWDSGESEGIGELTLSKSGNSLYVSISVPYLWMETATYPVVIDPSVAVDADASEYDAYELGTGTTSYTSTTNYIYTNADPESSSYRVAGIMFPAVGVPNGATINSCNISVYQQYSGSNDPDCIIYGNDVDTADNFSADTNIISRTRTTANVSWVVTDIGSDEFVFTPDLSDIPQEVVNRGGWASGNNMAFMFIANVNGSGNLQKSDTYDDGAEKGATLNIDYTAGGDTWDITNVPIPEELGILEASTTYYAFGSAPSNPVEDGECTFTANNTGSVTANVTIKCTDFIGGVGWTLTSGAPGEDTVRITAYYSGQNPASGIVLSNAEQDFCTINASLPLKWDFKIETGTYTDFIEKTANITLTSYEL